jgi:hypothetical protein
MTSAGSQSPITELEWSIIKKLGTATYPPYTASKRFVRDLSSGHIVQLSDRGRAFLAFIAHRFRRQYTLNDQEWSWVRLYLNRRTPVPTGKDILNTLKDANGYIALGATLAGQIVPIGKWVVNEFKALTAKGETVTFVVLVQHDTAELEAIGAMATDDLAAVNAELVKLGKPPLVIPTAPAPAIGADPAPGVGS